MGDEDEERQLLAELRSDVMARWTPPGGGYRGALNRGTASDLALHLCGRKLPVDSLH